MSFNWVELSGTILRYEWRPGRGIPVVLLHEMGGSLESWDGVWGCLSGRPVLRFDARGSGQSQKITSVSLDSLAEDVISLAEFVGIEKKFLLAGVAVGAAVALHIGYLYPGRIAGVVALAPATGVAPERRAAAHELASQISRDGIRSAGEDMLSRAAPPVTRGPGKNYEQIRHRFFVNDGPSFAAIYRMLIDLEMRAALASISCPVQLVAGEHDQFRPPEMVQALSETIAKSTYRVVDAGHFLASQAPTEVASIIEGFADELAVRHDEMRG